MSEKSLNQQIAELLGWRNIETYTYWYDDSEWGGGKAEALRGTPPDDTYTKRVPDFKRDLNAVAKTLEGRDVTLELDFSTKRAAILDWAAVRGMRTESGEAETIEDAAAQVLYKWLAQYPPRTPPRRQRTTPAGNATALASGGVAASATACRFRRMRSRVP